MSVLMFIVLSVSVVLTVYFLGMQIAFLYVNHTLGITFDVSLLFFTGKWDYFLLLNGFALYFVLDIFYNAFFSKKSGNRKRRLRRDEKLNYHHLAGIHESKKFLERLEFDSYGYLVNVDYNRIEILLGHVIIIGTIICFVFGVKDLSCALIENVEIIDGWIWLKSAVRGVLLFVYAGYLFALFHQEWGQYRWKQALSRLLRLHLRDWCDDVFDGWKQLWNKLVWLMKGQDVHKFNVKGKYRIGGEMVRRRGGFPVLTYRNRVYVNAADCHSLIVATTRAGKSYSLINIMVDIMRMNGESMVINDPKGEIKAEHVQKLINDGYHVHFLDFIEPEKGDGWNPLDVVIRKYREAQKRHELELRKYEELIREEKERLEGLLTQAVTEEERQFICEELGQLSADAPALDTSAAQEVLNDIANQMTYDEKDSNGRFFNSQAGALIVGYANLILEERVLDPVTGELIPLPDEMIHFKSIKQVSLAGAEPVGKNGETVLSQYLKKNRSATDHSVLDLSQYVTSPGPTKGSIDAVFSDKSRLMTMSESVMRMTSRSTFDLKNISREKTAVFIIVHGDKNTYYPFVTMFIEQMYQESMAVAREHNGRMPYPVNCIFDEAGIMPALKSIDNMVSFGASAGFRLTMAVQDTSQLERRYGREVAHTIMNNMQNFVYLMGGDNDTLKTVSEKAGKRLVWNKELKHYEEKPVISPERLQSLSMGEAVVLQMRKNPILTRLKGYKDYCFYKNMAKGNVETPQDLRPVPYFDLKKAYRRIKNVPEQDTAIKEDINPNGRKASIVFRK